MNQEFVSGDWVVTPNSGEWVPCRQGHDFKMMFTRQAYGLNPLAFFNDLEMACPDCAAIEAKQKRTEAAYKHFRDNYKRGRLRG